MKLIYTCTLDDHIAFNHWLIPSQPGYAMRFRVARVSHASRFLLPFLLLTFLPAAPVYIALILAAGFVLTAYAYVTYPRKVKAAREKCIRDIYKDGKGEGTVLGQHILELEGDTLTEKTVLSETKLKVASVTSVEEIADYVFVMMGPSQGYAIPRYRVEEGDLDLFVAALGKVQK